MYTCIDAYATCCMRYYIWYTEEIWLVYVVKDIRVCLPVRVCPVLLCWLRLCNSKQWEITMEIEDLTRDECLEAMISDNYTDEFKDQCISQYLRLTYGEEAHIRAVTLHNQQ